MRLEPQTSKYAKSKSCKQLQMPSLTRIKIVFLLQGNITHSHHQQKTLIIFFFFLHFFFTHFLFSSFSNFFCLFLVFECLLHQCAINKHCSCICTVLNKKTYYYHHLIWTAATLLCLSDRDHPYPAWSFLHCLKPNIPV